MPICEYCGSKDDLVRQPDIPMTPPMYLCPDCARLVGKRSAFDVKINALIDALIADMSTANIKAREAEIKRLIGLQNEVSAKLTAMYTATWTKQRRKR